MNPPRKDAWPQFEIVRFCLLRGIGNQRPVQALLLDTKISGQTKEYLVGWMHEHGPERGFRLDWVRRSRLVSIPVDPNIASQGRWD